MGISPIKRTPRRNAHIARMFFASVSHAFPMSSLDSRGRMMAAQAGHSRANRNPRARARPVCGIVARPCARACTLWYHAHVTPTRLVCAMAFDALLPRYNQTVIPVSWRPNAKYGIMSVCNNPPRHCKWPGGGSSLKEMNMDTLPLPRISGIYQITCIPTGKIYIGSAVDLWNRRRLHCNDLRGKSNRSHHSRYLQRAWDKYGEAAFSFAVLEYCDRDKLIEREQYYLDIYQAYDPSKGYNTAKIAGSSLGIRPSPEARRKQSERLKGRKRGPMAQEQKDRISAATKGRDHWTGRKHTPEAIAKQKAVVRLNLHSYRKPETGDHVSLALAKRFDGFISPDGETVSILNMRSFCKEHGLNQRSMYGVAAGRQPQHQGWTHRDHPKAAAWRAHTWKGFIDPFGVPVAEVVNLVAFCAQRGISDGMMRRVYFGKQVAHRGWTCKRDDDAV